MSEKETLREKLSKLFGFGKKSKEAEEKKEALPKLSSYKKVSRKPSTKKDPINDRKVDFRRSLADMRMTTGPKTLAVHEMGTDDTLSHVALKYYKNASKPYYEWIWQHNRALLGDSPNNTKPGMKIRVPELSAKLDGTYKPVVPKGCIAVHTVVQDDMLSKIAQKYYGNGNKPYYMWIYMANEDLLGDSPNNTRPGMELLIPELSDELKG